MSDSRNPFPPLTPNSRLALRLGTAVTIAGAFLFAGWSSANILRDIRDELAGLRKDVRAVSIQQWTVRDMRDYGNETEKLNTGITMPDARRIHRNNQNGEER